MPVTGFAILIAPRFAAQLQFGLVPMGIAETLTGLWLLFAGANPTYWNKKSGKLRAANGE
jgi:hypothetical protein